MKEKLAREHAAMLKEAISRPGVREAMEIYQNWKRMDVSLSDYRRVNDKRDKVVVTDNSNNI